MDSLLGFNSLTVMLSTSAVATKTLVQHYTQRKKITKDVAVRNDLAFDEAFCVVRNFFAKASLHTVEECQTFGNAYMPTPFHVRVIRVTVPSPCLLEAGKVIIQTLGEKEIKEVIGGTEWWQRTSEKSGGVKGEWISMKKDWQGLDADGDEVNEKDAERIRKMKENAKKREKKIFKEGKEAEEQWKKENKKDDDTTAAPTPTADTTTDGEDSEEDYSSEMDEMPCMMYIHGGAYFFGSINTVRYSIWRYARKMGGRAFSMDYRLAPQYPFPCALQDALASYLYLIRPPPGAKHRPVDPAKLTIAGDSAGGGLALALSCLIRDSGLPLPAGIVLVSPWVDLCHSFPSILENTGTDLIPPYGFLFKPSTLWPPPPAEDIQKSESLFTKDALKKAEEARLAKKEARPSLMGKRKASSKGDELAKKVEAGGEKEAGAEPDESNAQKAESGQAGKKQATAEVAEILKVKIDGEEVEVREQIQLYATNEQLVYPFVSPLWQPSLGGLPPMYVMCGQKEVLRDEIIYMAHRAANPEAYPLRQPLLDANPERTAMHSKYPPTKVHLQVYDDACHDLPLFSFTTPAKYCYRAIASFCKWVTTDDRDNIPFSPLPGQEASPLPSPIIEAGSSPVSPTTTTHGSTLAVPTVRRTKSSNSLNKTPSTTSSKQMKELEKTIYSGNTPFARPPFENNMIRERVAIDGVVRPLEPVEQMPAMNLDINEIGLVKESPVKRYLAGKAIWDKRFKKAYENVQKSRHNHILKSQREESKRIRKRTQLAEQRRNSSNASSSKPAAAGSDLAPARTSSPEPIEEVEGIWNLHGERPPPSSIAARKDNYEARQLAHVLDTKYSKLHALHLWTEVSDLKKKMGHSREDSNGSN